MTLGPGVRVGMAIPQIFPEGRVDMALVRDVVARAEELGFEELWAQEQFFGEVSSLEPLGLLSYVSGVSSKARLGVSEMVLPLHNPVHLAKRLVTVDQMSGGRLIVVLSLGTSVVHYAAFGLPTERRVRRLVEGLEVMRALWAMPAPRYEGDLWRLEGAPMEPKPAQRPHPPLWFGGFHPKALRRAVRLADGWMGAGSSSSDDFKDRARQVRQFLEEAQRDPATFVISKRVYIAVDDDERRAKRRLQEWFGRYYLSSEMATRVSVWGSAAHCVEQLEELAAAGANHLLLNPVLDLREQLEVLADLVGPLR